MSRRDWWPSPRLHRYRDQEVNHPMRRRIRILLRGRNAAEHVTPFSICQYSDVSLLHRRSFSNQTLPNRILRPDPILGVQVRPAEGARFASDSESRIVALRLPGAKHCSSRVLHTGHPSGARHIEGWPKGWAAQLRSSQNRSVRVIHGNVQTPMRRRTLRKLLGPQRAARSSIAAVHLENRVHAGRPHGYVVHLPAEQGTVEILSGILIRSGKFDPAKRAGRMFVDERHARIIVQRRGGRSHVMMTGV